MKARRCERVVKLADICPLIYRPVGNVEEYAKRTPKYLGFYGIALGDFRFPAGS